MKPSNGAASSLQRRNQNDILGEAGSRACTEGLMLHNDPLSGAPQGREMGGGKVRLELPFRPCNLLYILAKGGRRGHQRKGP